jgi:hypothetical protein
MYNPVHLSSISQSSPTQSSHLILASIQLARPTQLANFSHTAPLYLEVLGAGDLQSVLAHHLGDSGDVLLLSIFGRDALVDKLLPALALCFAL